MSRWNSTKDKSLKISNISGGGTLLSEVSRFAFPTSYSAAPHLLRSKASK